MDAVFRSAEACDFEPIASLFAQAISHMCANGIEQWDDIYPDAALLRGDIQNGEMHVLERGGDIFAAVVVNGRQDEEYAQGDWRCGNNAAVIHRLCVHPKHQHQGVAAEVMRHAERLIAARGYDSIRLDAYTQNPYALRLYERFGYQRAGEVTYRKGRFVLMEKALR